MPIELLANEVIDQIAAGEVVERPSHLVKELVENALDAQASEIEVAISRGGRSIRVSDNGSGMSRSDLEKACLRHATSKVCSVDDLWRLSSFGFRGEALSSIGSVSQLTITSRVDADEAYQVHCDFGQVSPAIEANLSCGTQIVVENLFENVPARLKFLKSAGHEVGQIRQTLKALALVHYSTQFRVLVEGQLDQFWPGCNSLLRRACQILEQEDLFYESVSQDGYELELVLSAPNQTFKTGKNLWFFVQDRWVQDRALHAAVMDGYRSLLMHGEYPLAVVRLRVPAEQVDVNVHPSKSQVKFEKPSQVFQLLQRSVRQALERTPWLTKMARDNSNEIRPRAADIYSPPQPFSGRYESDRDARSKTPLAQTQLGGTAFSQTSFRQKPEVNATVTLSEMQSSAQSRRILQEESHQETQFWSQLQVLGQAHLTYILAQNEQSFFLIDQHAAHERVLYERVYKYWQAGGVEAQRYLLPLMLDFAESQIEAIEPLLPEFARFGIEVEQAGPQTLAVTAAPSWLKESAIAPALIKTADEVVEKGGSFALENKVRDLAATMACHSAIRAGQSLSPDEMKALLLQMDEFAFSTFCPHGRPVYIQWAFHEIERDFGRLG